MGSQRVRHDQAPEHTRMHGKTQTNFLANPIFKKMYLEIWRYMENNHYHFTYFWPPPSQSYGFASGHVWMWEFTIKMNAEESMLLNCVVGEDSWESLGQQGDPTSPSERKSVLSVHWKDWCWSRNSNTLATWCEGLTHWKSPWYWERLRAGGEGDDRGWDG